MRSDVITGDALTILRTIETESVDCVVTSPPYWSLRDYGVEGQLGLEPKFQDYISNLCDIFDEVKRVLKSEGTCWVNIGDSYAGSGKGIGSDHGKASFSDEHIAKTDWRNQSVSVKSLVQIPSRFAIAMTDRGWILRNEIIWHKPNTMPQSVKDRFSVDFEKLFFFTKSKRYYFEQQFENAQDWGARKRIDDKYNNPGTGLQPHSGFKNGNFATRGRNKRAVWSIPTRPFKEAHFAVFPEQLVETPIKAGSRTAGVVLDPFVGSGTTGVVALRLARHFIGIELNPEYAEMARKRVGKIQRQIRMIFDERKRLDRATA